jgi:hypothetical protein
MKEVVLKMEALVEKELVTLDVDPSFPIGKRTQTSLVTTKTPWI